MPSELGERAKQVWEVLLHFETSDGNNDGRFTRSEPRMINPLGGLPLEIRRDHGVVHDLYAATRYARGTRDTFGNAVGHGKDAVGPAIDYRHRPERQSYRSAVSVRVVTSNVIVLRDDDPRATP